MATHEHTLNVALGEVLRGLRPHSWHVHAEETRTLRKSSKRPDVLIEEAAQWPVAIEAERESYDGAEGDARARLGQVVNETRKPIESAIALVYPPEMLDIDGEELRQALRTTEGLEYALLTRTLGGGEERLPESGWLKGSARDLAMLAHRASTPAPRVERMGVILEQSIEDAAAAFTVRHGSHLPGSLGADIASLLGQSDDQAGQTRRMAMTVVINALIFHEALATAEFYITAEDQQRRLRHLRELLSPGDFDIDALTLEWQAVLEINYWPIFATASEIIRKLPEETAAAVLTPLRKGALRLVQRGVTKSHDLTGVIFQRLIADRKFLATFYTRPAAAALLAGLAIPADRAPGGAEWGDEDSIASLQIGDFACGTGTLLSAAYQRISMLHELNGGDPRALHAPMMKNGLVGLDVLNIAVHLTAATLAGAHPDVPFEGECLLTMPYGGKGARVGSLELLAKHVQGQMVEDAAAITAGGRKPEDVRDLVSRIGHGKFDLVVMNPPFTRSGGIETVRTPGQNTAFSAFGTDRATQLKMSASVARLAKSGSDRAIGHGHAGLASHFADLVLRKLRRSNGTLALILPMSALSGSAWQGVRSALAGRCRDLVVVTIAGEGPHDRSFSADTGMAECLVVAETANGSDTGLGHQIAATFVLLYLAPATATQGIEIANQIQTIKAEHATSQSRLGRSPVRLGEDVVGVAVRALVPSWGPWPYAGILDPELAVLAEALSGGHLSNPNAPGVKPMSIPVARVGEFAEVGPHDMDIWGDKRDGSPQGPFVIEDLVEGEVPSFPALWAHDRRKERRLSVTPDSKGQIKSWQQDPSWVHEKAADIWATATRAHYNRDLQFNSQSLIVAMTDGKCIGGRAWPSVILHNPEHEFAFSLWCNSTLGLLLHWWVSNKTQSGRGTTPVTAIPIIPTLDTRALSDAQHAEAKRQFDLLRSELFLPFDQIDEDPARAKLDRAILIDVLGLPDSLLAPDGPIDLIRRKLAREPQIHGGKKSRVVFTDEGEKSVKRDDR